MHWNHLERQFSKRPHNGFNLLTLKFFNTNTICKPKRIRLFELIINCTIIMKTKSRFSRTVYAITDRMWCNKHLKHPLRICGTMPMRWDSSAGEQGIRKRILFTPSIARNHGNNSTFNSMCRINSLASTLQWDKLPNYWLDFNTLNAGVQFTLRLRQYERHFAVLFVRGFIKGNCCFMQISLKFVPRGSIKDKHRAVIFNQWRSSLLTHILLTHI